MRIASNIRLGSEIDLLRPAHVLEINWRDGSEKSLLDFLIWQEVDLLIADRLPSANTIALWKEARQRPVILLFAQTDAPDSKIEHVDDYCASAVVVKFDAAKTPLSEALAVSEHLFTKSFTTEATDLLLTSNLELDRRKVLVVGAGAVSLITALYLHESGYLVEIVERSKDPRSNAHWSLLGCTHGGENARMFSLTECDNYHDQEMPDHGRLHGQLGKSITEGGWLIGTHGRYTVGDHCWMDNFANVPIWLAKRYNEDIFGLSHESHAHWMELQQSHPQLFQNVELRHGLLRIAKTEKYHQKQVKRQKHVRAYKRELSAAEVASYYPALSKGVSSGEIAGGIEVEGFTVNIHSFTHNIIDYLEERGVSVRWETSVDEIIIRNEVVEGVSIRGRVEDFDHYFVSPGIYGPGLLSNTQSAGLVHGMLGAWISFPNLDPKLQTSLKVSREGHLANSGNIIVAKNDEGQDVLIFGSGFGYVGEAVDNIDPHQLDALFTSMEDYISQLFPRAYAQAKASGMLRGSRRYCIRPWTPSSLGVFEMKRAARGKMIIASGHNTGGFAQSPSVAKATIDALAGRSHSMHSVYSPDRFGAYWGRIDAAGADSLAAHS